MEKELQNFTEGLEKLVEETEKGDLFKVEVVKVTVTQQDNPPYVNNNQNGMGNISSPQP